MSDIYDPTMTLFRDVDLLILMKIWLYVRVHLNDDKKKPNKNQNMSNKFKICL